MENFMRETEAVQTNSVKARRYKIVEVNYVVTEMKRLITYLTNAVN